MKIALLLDANLSWRSVSVLQEYYDDCYHVDNINLTVPAKDIEIWEYARMRDLLIITNDEDFLNISIIKGFPPKIILLKTGNQNRKAIEHTLINAKPQIAEFSVSEEYGVLEIV